jgi:hypothetical protein
MAGVFQSTGYMTNPKVTTAYGNLLDSAAKIGTQGFQPYDQSAYSKFSQYVPNLVASQNPYQVNAAQGIADLQGFIGGQITPQALAYAQQSATPMQFQGVGQQQIDQYMSPYLKNVANSAMANINETNAQQQQQLLGNAVAKGAYGGDRAGIAQAQLARQQGLANNATLANLYNTGYGTALGEANVQQNAYMENQLKNRQLANAAGALYQNIGNQSQQAQLGQLQAQYNAGAAKQAQDQTEMSAAYQQFLNYNQQPYNQLNWYANVINGAPAAMGGQTVATIPQPSTLSQVGGLAATIAGTNFGNFGQGSATGQKRGGAIRPRAAGGRAGYAAAGAVAPSTLLDAQRAYSAAAQRQNTPLSTLNDLYGRYQDAKRAGPSAAVPDYGPLRTEGIFSQAQADAVKAASAQTDPNALPGAKAPSQAIAGIAAGVGLLGALGKLFGGGKGGGEGKSSGSTFNKPSTASTEQQDALNERAERVNDDMILLQDARERGQISPAEFSKKYDSLNKEFYNLQQQGAKIEPRDKGEPIADQAADIREQRGQAAGVAPAAGATAPSTQNNANATKTYQPSGFAGPQQKAEATDVGGVAPINYAGTGEFPVSRIDPALAIDFAKNNGLLNASPQELQAAGLSPEAIQNIMAYQSSPAATKSMDEGEMAMQPTLPTQALEPISTDEATNAQYQQYVNLGFTPEEARIAATANTPASGKFGSQATQDQQQTQTTSSAMDRLPGQPTSTAANSSNAEEARQAAIAKSEEAKRNFENLAGEAPAAGYTGTLTQNDIAYLTDPNWKPQWWKDKILNDYSGKNVEDFYTWRNANGYTGRGQDVYGENSAIINNNAPKYADYEEQKNKYEQAIDNSANRYLDSLTPYGGQQDAYGNVDITSLPLVESQGQWLQNMPNIEDINVNNITPYQDFSYQDQLGGARGSVQDQTSYAPPQFDTTDMSQWFDPGVVYDTAPSISTTSSGGGGSTYVTPSYEEENRGGRIKRRHRMFGGPTAPQFGIAPITMNYGMPTQADMTNLAEANAGAGVMPVAAGQQALAAQDFFRNQNG